MSSPNPRNRRLSTASTLVDGQSSSYTPDPTTSLNPSSNQSFALDSAIRNFGDPSFDPPALLQHTNTLMSVDEWDPNNFEESRRGGRQRRLSVSGDASSNNDTLAASLAGPLDDRSYAYNDSSDESQRGALENESNGSPIGFDVSQFQYPGFSGDSDRVQASPEGTTFDETELTRDRPTAPSPSTSFAVSAVSPVDADGSLPRDSDVSPVSSRQPSGASAGRSRSQTRRYGTTNLSSSRWNTYSQYQAYSQKPSIPSTNSQARSGYTLDHTSNNNTSRSGYYENDTGAYQPVTGRLGLSTDARRTPTTFGNIFHNIRQDPYKPSTNDLQRARTGTTFESTVQSVMDRWKSLTSRSKNWY